MLCPHIVGRVSAVFFFSKQLVMLQARAPFAWHCPRRTRTSRRSACTSNWGGSSMSSSEPTLSQLAHNNPLQRSVNDKVLGRGRGRALLEQAPRSKTMSPQTMEFETVRSIGSTLPDVKD